MKIMLDTCAYVGFKLNAVEPVEMIVRAELILFSPVVLGELMFGFRNGTRFKENMDDLNNYIQSTLQKNKWSCLHILSLICTANASGLCGQKLE